MIIINIDTKNKIIRVDTKSKIDNGGAGSGNWGHDGRPGKVGGSSKDGAGVPSNYKKERRAYGRRLRELAEAFGADNIGKKYKDKINKIKKEQEDKRRQEEVSGKIIYRGYDPENKNYKKGDQKRSSKMLERELAKARDENYKPEFETLVTTPRGAKLIKKDGKVAWVMSRMIRSDGTLTKGGLEALKNGQSEEEYNLKQANINKAIKLKKEREDKQKQYLKEKYNYDEDNDESDDCFKDMKKRAISKYGDNQELLQKTFKLPNNIKNILDNDFSAKVEANYWQTSDGSKQRIYFNVINNKGYKYPLKENFIEL